MAKPIPWLVLPFALWCLVAVAQEPEVPTAQQASRFVPLKSPLEEEPVVVEGRPLQDWFADFHVVANTRADSANTREDFAKMRRAEAVLTASAETEPMVSRLALWYASRPKVNRSYWPMINAAGKLALPAIYDHLRDGIARHYDGWCIEKLRKLDDKSPEAIAALISALYSRNTVYGNNDDDLPRKAAAYLSEIGRPALEPLLNDHLAEGRTAYWNYQAISGMGHEVVEPVLEFSLQHPEVYLEGVLGSFCKQAPDKVAPKLVSLLQNPDHKAYHPKALHALAIAVEPKVESYKRVPVNIEGEHVVALALTFLDDEATQSHAAQVIAGWSPKPPEARDRVVEVFVKDQAHRLRLLRVLASFPELPEEVAEPLLELHATVPGLFLEPWHRALSRLTPEGKAKIFDRMRAQAASSPRAMLGVMALDPTIVTRFEMKEQLRKTNPSILKWVPNP